MYCISCGQRLADDDRFCLRCGTPVKKAFEKTSVRGGIRYSPRTPKEGSGNSLHDTPTLSQKPSNTAACAPNSAPFASANVSVKTQAKRTLSRKGRKALIIGGISSFVVSVTLIVLIVVLVTSSRHDLSGTYKYNGRFPITTITFSTDGTFTARCDYYEYSTGAVYYGKYSKSGDVYHIEFTGAKSNSVNSVTNYSDENFGYGFKMSAQKRGNNALDIWVSGGNNYYAWMGTTVTFYQ
ncbi:MAG: zinc ribbon domain-containing protein [Clostridia bacterium]|nr:zinc ribbon domain-containing protein [Clostridia bacterium]